MNKVPDALREAVKRDLRPATPLRPPFVRALTLVPIAAAIVIGLPALHFFRPDMGAIGFVRAWGFSGGQAIAGLVIVAAALRESIPGRGLSRTAITWTMVGGLAMPIVLLLMTASRFDLGSPPGEGFVEGASCLRISALAALPALMVAAFLAARAFPVRPLVAGALYGLGCGLVADAGLRLFCDYSEPLHVLLAHGGAVASVTLAGALVAAVVARRS